MQQCFKLNKPDDLLQTKETVKPPVSCLNVLTLLPKVNYKPLTGRCQWLLLYLHQWLNDLMVSSKHFMCESKSTFVEDSKCYAESATRCLCLILVFIWGSTQGQLEMGKGALISLFVMLQRVPPPCVFFWISLVHPSPTSLPFSAHNSRIYNGTVRCSASSRRGGQQLMSGCFQSTAHIVVSPTDCISETKLEREVWLKQRHKRMTVREDF